MSAEAHHHPDRLQLEGHPHLYIRNLLHLLHHQDLHTTAQKTAEEIQKAAIQEDHTAEAVLQEQATPAAARHLVALPEVHQVVSQEAHQVEAIAEVHHQEVTDDNKIQTI